MKFSFLQFVREQRSQTPPVEILDLTGKTIVVTGANQGLGFEATKHLARMNPGRLILACRNKTLGEEAASNIQQETGCKTVQVWILDLASFASVIAFYERFEKEGGRLDILLENAALVPSGKEPYTDDGWAPALQVNNLSTNLLALLLLPRMLATAKEHSTTPRLVLVASGVHYWAKLTKDVVDSETPWRTYNEPKQYKAANGTARYFDTKLLNVLFVRALAARIPSMPDKKPYMTITAIDPGFCLTAVRKNQTGIDAFVSWVFEKWLARTQEEGSRQLVWAALAGQGPNNTTKSIQDEELHGQYCSSQQVCESSDWVIGAEGSRAQDVMWASHLSLLS
ncbi:hypothetical protein D9619_011199 [Psilocybe cf. subviscida]|uniref:Uncharacterized protein n=1 Tax=Psilocybe cf. subviscida TaxID=2480587 RepID=A0A8H5F562_9AGAR|nr:hypothetical protein D9619_011199 [Psilocybe cf. subviscida]